MDYFELYESEQCLIDILRNFEFLRRYSYKEYELSYFVRAYPSISFKNSKTNQIISIIGSDLGSTDIQYNISIERRKLFSSKVFAVEDCYSIFGSSMMKGKIYSLKSQAEFMQQHLLPIIKGEMWLDELRKRFGTTRPTGYETVKR